MDIDSLPVVHSGSEPIQRLAIDFEAVDQFLANIVKCYPSEKALSTAFEQLADILKLEVSQDDGKADKELMAWRGMLVILQIPELESHYWHSFIDQAFTVAANAIKKAHLGGLNQEMIKLTLTVDVKRSTTII